MPGMHVFPAVADHEARTQVDPVKCGGLVEQAGVGLAARGVAVFVADQDPPERQGGHQAGVDRLHLLAALNAAVDELLADGVCQGGVVGNPTGQMKFLEFFRLYLATHPPTKLRPAIREFMVLYGIPAKKFERVYQRVYGAVRSCPDFFRLKGGRLKLATPEQRAAAIVTSAA